ncbi:U4/U6-U5 snRNP complex subunit SNU23 ASCRUDRAFT_5893 [Ascoidea rubescens DSM 1968]|uniref:C2H2-type domain-containing protein n=1 Tax=Ascoidea rubescens DSM 1968 TaxID=1344418 RepID=A0A1D2VR13_9ASCO|nr:hypothetical protein ASCRUDRAFT_5893 [Ascoidea rubescens DSM 1968]ODV63997.1 hypothetical protein ASCRUDRAFT_5893 [Ascoidea rubescens DSM 1968]
MVEKIQGESRSRNGRAEKDGAGNKEDSLVGVNSYGRKTWNQKAYAKLAYENRRNRFNNSNDNSKIDDGGQLKNKRVEINFETNLNKQILTDQSKSQTSHKGKLVGFYCESCNLTFKDNLSFLDHINSSYHLNKTRNLVLDDKERQKIRNITAEDVRNKIEKLYELSLRKQKEENDGEYLKFNARIEKRRLFLENEKTKKKMKRLKKKKELEQVGENADSNSYNEGHEMSSIFNFSGFGTTKKH